MKEQCWRTRALNGTYHPHDHCHFRHHIGDVNPAERQRTMSLQTKLESHAKVALENEHAMDSKVIWLNALCTLDTTARWTLCQSI